MQAAARKLLHAVTTPVLTGSSALRRLFGPGAARPAPPSAGDFVQTGGEAVIYLPIGMPRRERRPSGRAPGERETDAEPMDHTPRDAEGRSAASGPRGEDGAAGRDRPVRALIVGAGSVGRQLADQLSRRGRYLVVGFVDDRMEAPLPGLPILGDRDETPELVRVHDVEAVFMACAPSWQHEMAETLAAHQPHVDLQVVPSFYEAMLRGHRVENVGDIALVPLSVAPSRLTLFLKRSFDLVCAALMLIATVPLMALVSALIKLTSRGPIIFAQERVGQHGRTFRLYKFRTMRQDAEEKTGPVLSPGSHDARMTPVGKWLRIFRIDELPQLWNVLRGEMSVVGPRPERPYFVERFAERDPVYVRRHAVRPGITGMAQVLAGYHTDARDKLRFDLIYIAHQSIGLDLKILWYTLVLIVRSRDY